MKKKPDAMLTMILLFFVGLVVSGFSSMSVGSDEENQRNYDDRSAKVVYDRSVSRY